MKWREFRELNKNSPVILSTNLGVQLKNEKGFAVQLSRWKKKGFLLPLKKGVYLLNSLDQKDLPFEPFLAQQLLAPSYISLEKAFEFYGLIPESVPVFTSITTKQPRSFNTPLGKFRYYHIQPRLFWGYNTVQKNGLIGFMALPEKALLDFLYLHHPTVTEAYLKELRFQNVDRFDLKRLEEFSLKMGGILLKKRSKMLIQFLKKEQQKDQPL